MEPERTTTMGDLLSERRERDFHSVKAVLRIRAKERVWVMRAWGLREEREGMLTVIRWGGYWVGIGVWAWVGLWVADVGEEGCVDAVEMLGAYV